MSLGPVEYVEALILLSFIGLDFSFINLPASNVTKQKYYVVWSGRHTGIFDNWADCKRSVDGFTGARYKSFPTKSEAIEAYREPAPSWSGRTSKSKVTLTKASHSDFIRNAIVVDAACSGNPGLLEYQGFNLSTGDRVFHKGPYEEGTNNIGEFLAIVHALAMLKKENSRKVLYSDSMTAIAWVRNGKAKTKLEQTSRNDKLFDLIDRAEKWLQSNTWNTEILKWETERWGENPADFGRK